MEYMILNIKEIDSLRMPEGLLLNSKTTFLHVNGLFSSLIWSCYSFIHSLKFKNPDLSQGSLKKTTHTKNGSSFPPCYLCNNPGSWVHLN